MNQGAASESSIYWSLLGRMLRIRRFEERVAELYSEQEMRCPVHLSIGQEATAAGACEALSETDLIVGNHRSHGHYIAKGGSLKAMLAEMYGKSTGCSKGLGGSMHLVDLQAGVLCTTPIVGGTIPVAVGAALSLQMRRDPRVVLLFLGDAAVEEGVFSESLNFAVLKKLPIVFFCENNLYSVYTPLRERQPEGREIHKMAEGFGPRVRTVDGNDAFSVFRVTKESVEFARMGSGPTFIEAATYRWREHCGPNFDNDLGYRTVEEFENWRKFCPIEQHLRAMKAAGVFEEAQYSKLELQVQDEILEAVNFAKISPIPQALDFEKAVYPQ